MSLRLALQVVGLLVVGYILVVTFLAMGPLGWLILGPMIVIGVVQVYRRRQRDDAVHGGPDYCPNCGTAVDADAFDAETTDEADREWTVDYCSDCGAPLESTTTGRPADSSSGPTNCPDCGSPNDPDRATCKHCDREL